MSLDLISVMNDGALSARDKAARLEALNAQRPQEAIDTTHLLHAGMYARTIFVPAGRLLTGGEMRSDNVCVVCGDITVTMDDGPRRLTGYHVIPAGAAFKRAGITHGDTYWTTFIVSNAKSVHEAEDDMTTEADRLQTRQMIEHQPTDRLEA